MTEGELRARNLAQFVKAHRVAIKENEVADNEKDGQEFNPFGIPNKDKKRGLSEAS